MTIEEMKQRKRELGYSYEKIAQLSGLPLGTVQKVLGGITKSPRYKTLQALEAVLGGDVLKEDAAENDPAEISRSYERFYRDPGFDKYAHVNEVNDNKVNYGSRDPEDAKKENMVNEGIPYMSGSSAEEIPLKKQGEYTLEDYYALPDERRVELIDGVIYDMATPTYIHQIIAGHIYAAFFEHVRKKKGKCIPMIAPLDVQLDMDNKTMVEPDVLILCDKSKLQRGIVYGAPDLVVEILSPSTRSKDMVLKLNKYCHAGVREYWMVDPKNKNVIVYKFEDEIECRVYERKTPVPVGIWNDECLIDFDEIFRYIEEIESQE